MAFERFKKFNVDDLIAKNPADPRDSSRFMVLDRKTRTIQHKIFRDLPQFVNSGDTIVINNSKVFPAKLFARKETGGKIEILLVRQLEDKNCWAVLLRQYKPNTKLIFEGGLEGEVISNTENAEAVNPALLPRARLYAAAALYRKSPQTRRAARFHRHR